MRLLLDAHFSRAVSRPLRVSGTDAWTLDEWHDGRYRHSLDDQILEAAAAEDRTLVTYDCKSFPDLIVEWAESRRSHGGVILADDHTIRQQDYGGQIRALRALVAQYGDEPWVDRVMYLRPA
jgi:predicted nuclease of predicted toxin-antitoxin system